MTAVAVKTTTVFVVATTDIAVVAAAVTTMANHPFRKIKADYSAIMLLLNSSGEKLTNPLDESNQTLIHAPPSDLTKNCKRNIDKVRHEGDGGKVNDVRVCLRVCARVCVCKRKRRILKNQISAIILTIEQKSNEKLQIHVVKSNFHHSSRWTRTKVKRTLSPDESGYAG